MGALVVTDKGYELGFQSGSKTSLMAAINNLPNLKANQQRFLLALIDEPQGLTAYEVVEKIWREDWGFAHDPIQDGRNYAQCKDRFYPRASELKAHGLIVQLEDKGLANSGSKAAYKLCLPCYAKPVIEWDENGQAGLV